MKTVIFRTPAGEQAVMANYDAVLARWPVPYEALHVPTRFGDAHVIAWGKADAAPLVLLHGAGSNSCIWMGSALPLAGLRRVYAVDLMGEPGKTAPARPPWEGTAFSDWMKDVFDGLGLETAALCGISQGGWTALQFAVNHAPRVNQLILLAPGGVTPDRVSFFVKVILLSPLGKWGNDLLVDMIFAGKKPPAEVSEAMTLINRHFIRQVGIVPVCTEEELRRLSMPTYLLMGEKDVIRDAHAIRSRLESLLPRFKAVLLPDEGHAMMQFNDPLLAFLEEGDVWSAQAAPPPGPKPMAQPVGADETQQGSA